MEKDKKYKLMRGYYFLEHKHWPEDEKKKINCEVCQEKFYRTWKQIVGEENKNGRNQLANS